MKKTVKKRTRDIIAGKIHLENCRILALDDDQEILDLMCRLLKGTKAQITTTVCGEDAIKEYQETCKAGQLIVSSGYAEDPVLANHIQNLHS